MTTHRTPFQVQDNFIDPQLGDASPSTSVPPCVGHCPQSTACQFPQLVISGINTVQGFQGWGGGGGGLGLLLLLMVAAVSGDTGLGLRHVTSAEVKELDEDVGQEENDTATTQAAECWGRIREFLGGGAGGILVSQDFSLYLSHNQEADGE